ncbi:uncharacterized protein VP01_1271g4 [Puccinia sorghi]|uniref:Uncharacterized protein n=1 Tax=Puccinia sorghi TaxID=27349 RepID=A0A0L6VP82_9BASI|nr:uncharacterized protein VP01_1271g4 [Puccinia sorghi]
MAKWCAFLVKFFLGLGIGGDYPLSAFITPEFSVNQIWGRIMSTVFASQGKNFFKWLLLPRALFVIWFNDGPGCGFAERALMEVSPLTPCSKSPLEQPIELEESAIGWSEYANLSFSCRLGQVALSLIMLWCRKSIEERQAYYGPRQTIALIVVLAGLIVGLVMLFQWVGNGDGPGKTCRRTKDG